MKRATKSTRGSPRKAREQNWEERMEAAQLHHMAEKILGIPPTYGDLRPDNKLFNPGRGEPLRPLELGDYERWQLADYLRSLATPRMLQAMQKARNVKRPGRKGDPSRNWKAALDAHLTSAQEAPGHWSIGQSHVYGLIGELTPRSAGCWPGSWRYFAAFVLRRLRAVHLPWEARRGLTVVQVKGLLAQKLRAGAYDDIYEGLR